MMNCLHSCSTVVDAHSRSLFPLRCTVCYMSPAAATSISIVLLPVSSSFVLSCNYWDDQALAVYKSLQEDVPGFNNVFLAISYVYNSDRYMRILIINQGAP